MHDNIKIIFKQEGIVMFSQKSTFLRLWGACILGSVAVMPYILSNIDTKGLFAPLSVVAGFKIFQDVLIYGLVSFLGIKFSSTIGIRLPFFSQEKCDSEYWVRTIWYSIVSGVCVGMTILSLDLLLPRIGPAVNETTVFEIFHIFMASFYGGINEEVFMRLFFLSFFVWLLIKIFGSKQRDTLLSVAIFASALLFGVFHLPAAAKLVPLSFAVIIRVVLLNSIAGIMFGLLFTRCGLEAAMIAHFTADLVIHVFPAAAMMMFL